MGSNFQQVASFSHPQMQNLNEFEHASLRDSVQGLLSAIKGNNFLILSHPGKLASRGTVCRSLHLSLERDSGLTVKNHHSFLPVHSAAVAPPDKWGSPLGSGYDQPSHKSPFSAQLSTRYDLLAPIFWMTLTLHKFFPPPWKVLS